MAHAIALTRKTLTVDPVDQLRCALVTGCALALIAAGQFLPFIG